MNAKSVLLLSAIFAGACSSTSPTNNDLGPADMSGPPPSASDMADPTLSPRAARGLMLSPAPIDTAAMPLALKEQVGTGAYLVVALNCANCHGATPASFLAGGRQFGTANPVYARNLTPHGTTGMKLSEVQFIESMRTGKDFVDNGALVNMPFTTYRWLTTNDIRAIYAYLKALPAVDNQVPPDMKVAPGSPVPAPTAYSDGILPRSLIPDTTPDPLGEQRGLALQVLLDPPGFDLYTDAKKRSFGRGAYLVTLLNCTNCHTNPATTAGRITSASFLGGGRVFASGAQAATLGTVRVMSSNLIGQSRGLTMSQPQFIQTLQTNKHADEASMRALGSPMPDYKNLVDEDMAALYSYLTAVPRVTGAGDKAAQEYARYCTGDGMCNAAAGETCALATNECAGKTCAADVDCDACQTCTSLVCTAPVAGAACLTRGL